MRILGLSNKANIIKSAIKKMQPLRKCQRLQDLFSIAEVSH